MTPEQIYNSSGRMCPHGVALSAHDAGREAITMHALMALCAPMSKPHELTLPRLVANDSC
jgi:hypothetical protein